VVLLEHVAQVAREVLKPTLVRYQQHTHMCHLSWGRGLRGGCLERVEVALVWVTGGFHEHLHLAVQAPSICGFIIRVPLPSPPFEPNAFFTSLPSLLLHAGGGILGPQIIPFTTSLTLQWLFLRPLQACGTSLQGEVVCPGDKNNMIHPSYTTSPCKLVPDAVSSPPSRISSISLLSRLSPGPPTSPPNLLHDGGGVLGPPNHFFNHLSHIQWHLSHATPGMGFKLAE